MPTPAKVPYNNLSWGSGSRIIQKTGWSNYNALQANYQRLFHGGSAWQILGVWAKSLRTGGDFGGNNGIEFDPYSTYVNSGPSTVTATPEGGTIGPINATAPPPPTGTLPWQYYKALDRWENYQQDPNVPWLHFQFNGLVALPFGHGQRYLSGAGKALNELVGGWQIAGDGAFGAGEFTLTPEIGDRSHPRAQLGTPLLTTRGMRQLPIAAVVFASKAKSTSTGTFPRRKSLAMPVRRD